MTKEECQELVVQIYATYNQALPEMERKNILRAWYDIIHDLPYEEAKKEALNLAVLNTFMPKPGELRKAYINRHNKMAQQPTPQVAWAILMDIIRGANQGTPYQNEIPEAVRRTMKLLGDTLFGLSSVYDQQNFTKTYEQVVTELQSQIYEIPEKGA